MNKNPYEVLGVSKTATDAEIKKAYHKLVMQYHPDKNPGNKEAEEKFKDINNAFDILKDPQKRAAYDRFGDAAFAGGNTSNGFNGENPFGTGAFHFGMNGEGMEDILREAMKGFGFGGFGDTHSRTQQDRSGKDLLDEVTISLKEAFYGKSHTVKFFSNVKCEKCNGHGTHNAQPASVCKRCKGTGFINTRQGFFAIETPCPECNGLGRIIEKKCSVCNGIGTVNKQRTLDIQIPAGVQDKTRLRVPGMGEAAPNGGPAGDFYLDIYIKPDQNFKRNGLDLFLHADVDFATLALGGEIEVHTIDDKTLSLKIQPGTQLGEQLRIKEYGMPSNRGQRGNLYIDIGTKIPTKLNEKQKKALYEYANIKNDKKSWF